MHAAITGIGMVLPTGGGIDALWSRWLAQASALRPYCSETISSQRIGYYGAVDAQDHVLAREAVPHKLRRYGTPTAYLGVSAAGQALRQAGLDAAGASGVPGASRRERWGLYTAQGDYTSSSFLGFARALDAQPGTGTSAALDFKRLTDDALNRRGLDPFSAIKGLANNLLALVSLTHRFCGEGGAFVQSESAVHAALDAALFALRERHCDLALVVSAGSYDEVWTLAELTQRGALSACTRQAHSLRSFDRSRDGTVLAEGAVALVLESAAHARGRGAQPLGWIRGAGCSASALGQPLPDAAYRRATERALRQAGAAALPQAEIDAALVDGKGTLDGDSDEIRLLRHLGLHGLPLSTVRPITGLVAAGALVDVALATALLQHGRIPPVAGLDDPQDSTLNWVRGSAREQPLRRVLTLQHGFGGFCSAVVVDHPASFS